MADNAHIVQTRLILLDAPLIFFMACALFCYVRFYRFRGSEFSSAWWTWLSATGVSLALTISCKGVGLFTFMTIGMAVVIDLWNLLDIRRGLTLVRLPFSARADDDDAEKGRSTTSASTLPPASSRSSSSRRSSTSSGSGSISPS